MKRRFVSTLLTACMLMSMTVYVTASDAGEFNTVDPENYPWNVEGVEDTSDLPTWTGKQITLTWWNAHGSDIPAEKAVNDVVNPEITRVTGVTVDYDNSFGNGDNTYDVKLSMLAGSQDWPSIVTDPNSVAALVEGDVVYDLTELIPQYCPNLWKYYGPDTVFGDIWNKPSINGGQEGKIYAIPTHIDNYSRTASYSKLQEGLPEELGGLGDENEYFKNRLMVLDEPVFSYLTIRDDILKQLYPEAHTKQELVDIYQENGTYTREEVFDVPLKTPEDFYQLLRDIHDLNLTENGQPVYPTYAYSAIDTYPIGWCLYSTLYGTGGVQNPWTYWDTDTKSVGYTFEKDDFKDLFLNMNQLIREGVLPKESLIDDENMFQAKMNSGQYALSYCIWRWPDDQVIQDSGKDYEYRRLWMDVPLNTEDYVQFEQATIPTPLLIFKDEVAEEDLPQILMWVDYQLSQSFYKARYWGPESAGLFEVVDGKRQFIDKDLEDAMLTGNNADLIMSYNLFSGIRNESYSPRRRYLVNLMATSDMPAMVYQNEEASATDAIARYSSGLVESREDKKIETYYPSYDVFADSVSGMKSMFESRSVWEEALNKTLTAESDEEFEELWQAFLQTSKDVGLTEEALNDMNEYFSNYNAEYMDNLINYQP